MQQCTNTIGQNQVTQQPIEYTATKATGTTVKYVQHIFGPRLSFSYS